MDAEFEHLHAAKAGPLEYRIHQGEAVELQRDLAVAGVSSDRRNASEALAPVRRGGFSEGDFHQGLAPTQGNQLGDRATGDDLAVIDKQGPAADALDLLHVMGAVNHGSAGIGGAADGFQDLLARLRIDADGRLVEQQQIRSMDHAAGEIEPPLHPAGEHGDRIVRALRQPDFL